MREERFSFPDFFANNPIIVTVCFVFLVADIVLLDHIITDRIHRKEIRQHEYIIKELQTGNKGLNDKYNQLNDMYNRLNTMYKELETKSGEIQSKVDSRLSSLTENLSSCQDTNLKFIGKIKEQDSETASLRNDLQDNVARLDALRRLFAGQLALEPTWIKAGEVSRAFSDDVALTVDEPSDGSRCPKGSPAVVHLESESGKKDLCVQMDQPQSFTYKGKRLLLHVLEVKESEEPHEFLVSIVKEREKTGGRAP